MNSQPPEIDSKVTIQSEESRSRLPVWMREMPRLRVSKEPVSAFQLIDRGQLRQLVTEKNLDKEAVTRIESDLEFLEYELLRLFSDRDHKANLQQNRHRLYTVQYITLGVLAVCVGALIAVAVATNPPLVPYLAVFSTLLALVMTFLGTISGREPPVEQWYVNRRRAEMLRREYFRFLMRLPPYQDGDDFQIKRTLSQRAADINRGLEVEGDAKHGSTNT